MKRRRSSEAPGEVADPTVVVVGTYDGGLLGFGLAEGVQSFGYAPHTGCVKALHCTPAGKLASGATDNTVRLFDLMRGTELGELQEHEDSVTCLEFAGTTNLITGSGDGQVCIWRCSDWELLLKFKGHKAAVAALSVHPSNRLMASAGRDLRVRLWDLMRGTSAANLSMPENIEVLRWSPTGERLVALSPKNVTVVEAGSGKTVSYADPSSAGFMRVSLCAAAFISERLLAVGDGAGAVRVLTATAKGLEEACRLTAEGAERSRVKALERTAARQLIVGMSSGRVEVWSYKDSATPTSSDFTLLRSVETRVRLTCVTIWSPTKAPTSKAAAAEAEPKRKAKRKKGGKNE